MMIMKASIYSVLFTLARRHDRSRAAVLAKNHKFSLPPSHLAFSFQVTFLELKLYGS